jgi:hypothetical protein
MAQRAGSTQSVFRHGEFAFDESVSGVHEGGFAFGKSWSAAGSNGAGDWNGPVSDMAI